MSLLVMTIPSIYAQSIDDLPEPGITQLWNFFQLIFDTNNRAQIISHTDSSPFRVEPEIIDLYYLNTEILS